MSWTALKGVDGIVCGLIFGFAYVVCTSIYVVELDKDDYLFVVDNTIALS